MHSAKSSEELNQIVTRIAYYGNMNNSLPDEVKEGFIKEIDTLFANKFEWFEAKLKEEKKEVLITGVAIKTSKGIVCGFRHDSCFKIMLQLFGSIENLKKENKIEVQGFVTNTLEFVDRREALEIVRSNSQPTKTDRKRLMDERTEILLSEDLW